MIYKESKVFWCTIIIILSIILISTMYKLKIEEEKKERYQIYDQEKQTWRDLTVYDIQPNKDGSVIVYFPK